MKKKVMITLQTLYGLKKIIFDFAGINYICDFLETKTAVRPNHITIINWLVGFGALYFLFVDHVSFVVLIVIHFLMDNLDGYYARTRGLQTKLGECFDHVGDFIFGELFMLKSWWYFGDWWILLAMAVFLIEGVMVLKLGYAQDKFPARMFLAFFVLGFYRLGMVVQVFYQPITFVGFLILKKMSSKTDTR